MGFSQHPRRTRTLTLDPVFMWQQEEGKHAEIHKDKINPPGGAVQTCSFDSAYSLSGTLMRAGSLESGRWWSSCSLVTLTSITFLCCVVIPTTTTRCRRASKSKRGHFIVEVYEPPDAAGLLFTSGPYGSYSSARPVCSPEDDQWTQWRQDHWSCPHRPMARPALCLVTPLTTLPLSDLFLLVSIDLISPLIKYLPCPATNRGLHLQHRSGFEQPREDSGCFHQLPVKSRAQRKTMEGALHHNMCLLRPVGMQQTCK